MGRNQRPRACTSGRHDFYAHWSCRDGPAARSRTVSAGSWPGSATFDGSAAIVERVFVLGIDPGLSRCGYGCVRRDGSKLTAVAAGVITTPPTQQVAHRLATLGDELASLVAEYRPDVVAVERVFFQTNARTAIFVAQASGLALAAAARAGCRVVEYTSNEVKQAVAGHGGATKAQVQSMVTVLLRLPLRPEPPDAADALALAICHLTIAPMLARIEAAVGSPRSVGPTAPVAPAAPIAPTAAAGGATRKESAQ
jgi:crossover junction endodeoxyribonuclease RuvC